MNFREKLVEKLNAMDKDYSGKHLGLSHEHDKLSHEHNGLSRDHVDIQKALSSAQNELTTINRIVSEEKGYRKNRDEFLLKSDPTVKQAVVLIESVFVQLQDAHKQIGLLQADNARLREENDSLNSKLEEMLDSEELDQ